MGWTGVYSYPKKANGKPDAKKHLDNYYQWESETAKFSVLKSSMVGSVYYAAVQKEFKDGSALIVFAAIALTSFDYRDDCFLTKEMTEADGPNESKCPIGILKLLTPTSNEYANEWRARCYAAIEEKKAEKSNKYSLKNLPVGSQIHYISKYETSAYHKGEDVKIRKTLHNGKEIWTDGMYRFNKNILPKEYDVLSVGNEKLDTPVHVDLKARIQQEERV